MSGNGNGRIAKFHKRVSEKAGCKQGEQLPYAPDFLDSLVRRIADPSGDMMERTFAWNVYRASGNQSEFAIHIYATKGETPVETELRQRDCALEIAWVEAGHRVEWWDAPLQMLREEAARRGVEPIARSLICDGFTENRERGSIASNTGHRLELVHAPFVADSPEIHRTKGESPAWKDFAARWNVAHSTEYSEELVARSIIKRNNKFRLSAYKSERKLATSQQNGGTSLEALETLEPLEATPPAPPVPVPPPPVPAPPINKQTPPAGGRASLHSEPARPPEWHSKLRKILEALPISTVLDELMFLRIAIRLTEELLPQFEIAANEAKASIRKWSGYEGVAKQVEARGLVKVASAGAGAEESYVERRAREIVESRKEKSNGRP